MDVPKELTNLELARAAAMQTIALSPLLARCEDLRAQLAARDAEIARLTQERDTLAARIEKVSGYARHTVKCALRTVFQEVGQPPCTCGLDALLTDAPDGGPR